MLTQDVYDTFWLVMIIAGVGGLALGISLFFKLRSDRTHRRRRSGRYRGRDQFAQDI